MPSAHDTFHHVRPLQVDPDGLHRLAARCRAWSSELSDTHVPIAGESISATAAAADALDAAVRITADDLAHRLHDIAGLLDEAADVHRNADDVSAAALADGTMRPS